MGPAARISAKQRAIKISKVVEKIAARAYEEGLAGPILEKLLDVVTFRSHLDQASINTLVKNLYPASKVSDTIVIKVIGTLGHGQAKPGYNVQAALLKWLIMVYDVLENPKVLSQLYSLLFNLLDTIALRYALKWRHEARLLNISQSPVMSRAVSDHSSKACTPL